MNGILGWYCNSQVHGSHGDWTDVVEQGGLLEISHVDQAIASPLRKC